MSIFITGGTGLIGRALIKQLIEKEPMADIFVLSRDKNKAQQLLPPKTELVSNIDEVDFKHFKTVINLAGEPIIDKRWSEQQKQRLCESRWHLTGSLAEKINRDCDVNNPIRFISGSAVGIYGRQDNRIITENFKNHFPEFSHHICSQWEESAKQATNANVSILRTGIVLSNDGGALSKLLLPFKMGMGGRVGNGAQYMPWIHIEDMVNAILHLIDHPVLTGEFNLTSPNPVTNQEFSKALAKTLNRPCIFPVPEFILKLIMGERADLLIYGQNAVPQQLLDSGFKFKFEHLPHALEDLLR